MRRTLHRAAAAVLTATLALGGVVALGVAPASAATVSYAGTIDAADPFAFFGCATTGSQTAYEERTVRVSQTGSYTFSQPTMNGDAHFSIRDGSTCVTDVNNHSITTQLTAGTTYTVRLQNYPGYATTGYVVSVTGPGEIWTTNPTATISQAAGQADPSASSPVGFAVTFSEPVTGFSASGVTVAGPSGTAVLAVTGSGSSYVVSVGGMTSSGVVSIAVPAGAATGSITGLPSSAATASDASITYAPRPTATVQQSATQADAASTLPITFDVRFSEVVNGFVAGDVTVSGTAGPAAVSVSGSGTSYVVSVADAQRPGTIEVSVPGNVAQTVFGAGNLEASSTDRSVTFQPSAPVASIAAVSASTTAVPAQFAVTFDGPVQGFDASDVLLGGTAEPSGVSVSGSGASYVVSIADAAQAGTITAQVRGIAVTRYTLTNAASGTATTQFAPPRPTATIEQSAAQADPTTQPTAVFDVAFSESVTGLDASDLVVGGTAGATQVSLAGSGAAYVATVTGATQPGSITLALPEAAATSRFQETSLAATSVDAEVAFEPLAPTVVVSLADGQDSPTTSSSATFVLTFSEAVSGLGVDDLVIDSTSGGLASVQSSDGGVTWVAEIVGLERAGDVTLSVRAAAVENVYGLPNASSNAATVTFAPVRPSVTVEQSATQIDAAGVDGFAFDVVFSQPVTGLEATDLVVGGTAGATDVEITGDGDSYVAIVSGATQPGTVTLSLPEGAATGAFEAASLASTSIDGEVTFAPPAPTVTVEQGSSQEDPASFGVIVFDVTFSHDVTGLDPASFVVGGTAGGTSVLLEGSGSTYRAYVADMTQPGTVTLALAEGAAVDRYGVASVASTSVDATVDFQPPAPTATVVRAEGQPLVANAQPFVFDVSFSVPVSGFDADDVVVTGDTGATIVEVAPRGVPQSSGDAAAADVAAADELGYDWTVRVSGATSYGAVSIGIREGAVVSGYGLSNAAIEPTADGSVVYAPAVVATPPVAPAPVAAPPVAASAAQAALPQTGTEAGWVLVLGAMLALAAGGLLRRSARTR